MTFSKQQIHDLVDRLPDDQFELPAAMSIMKLLSYPPEPQSKGSMVRDVEGDYWVRTEHSPSRPWSASVGTGGSSRLSWAIMNDKYGPVTVLYVTPRDVVLEAE